MTATLSGAPGGAVEYARSVGVERRARERQNMVDVVVTKDVEVRNLAWPTLLSLGDLGDERPRRVTES
jgi:hypothetical protein